MTEVMMPVPDSTRAKECGDSSTEISTPELPQEVISHFITPKERECIARIRERMGILLTARYTDVRICRFLRARDLHVDKAEEMLRKEIKWRAEVNPQKIYEEFPSHPLFKPLMDYWPGVIHGVDKAGVPVCFERIGAVDPASLFKNVTKEDLIKFHIYMVERNDEILEKSFEKIGAPVGYVYVMDVAELGFKHRCSRSVEVLKEITAIDDNYYPESLRRFIVVNTPFLFTFFWKIAKLLLHKKTIEKFTIVKHGYLPEIEKSVDNKYIPKYLGGGCSGCTNDCKHGGGEFCLSSS